MALLDIGLFFGRFHPLFVHLPIGFLLLAILFSLLSCFRKFRALRIAVPISLLIGSVSAAFASITGYVLSFSGDYDAGVMDNHMWAGIFTTILSFLAYFICIKRIPGSFLRHKKALPGALIIIFIFISITGHLGGTLTHGAGYLSTAVLFDDQKEKEKIADLNEVYVFDGIVHPILIEKCGSCHNASKKKGKLSVESYQALAEGGRNGVVFKPGSPFESELLKRVLLNPKHKKYMPADGHTPLTAAETAIIKWWIEKGAAVDDVKFLAANPPEEIKRYAASWFNIDLDEVAENNEATNIQAPPVLKNVLQRFKDTGFVIKYLNYNPDLLDVTLPGQNKENVSGKLKALLVVKHNILWLNVAGTHLSDDDIDIINQFKNLERLRLDNNPITDKGIAKLRGLTGLQALNIYGTSVTKNCLPSLRKIPGLRTAYVWKTQIMKKDILPLDPTLKIIGAN